MSARRPLFARLLIALLLSLWAAGPAHCLALPGADDMALCRAASNTPDPTPALAHDHVCPACSGLAWAPAPPLPAVPAVAIAWAIRATPIPPADRLLRPQRLPPWQSRAPPRLA